MKKAFIKSVVASLGILLLAVDHTFSADAIINSVQQQYKDQTDNVHDRLPRVRGIANSVLVVGPTGTGKSTLLTLLGGAEMNVIRNPSGKLAIDGRLGDGDVHIFHRMGRPGTHFPTPWRIESPDSIAFWDCPGFADVGGAVPDLIHMTSFGEVLANVKNVKILCVIHEDMITSRGNQIPSLFKQLTSLFPDFEQLKKMISLVITRKTAELDPLVDLVDYVEDDENNQEFTPNARELVRYLIATANDPGLPIRVWYMPRPTAVGPYELPLLDFWQVFNNSDYVENPEFNPILTPSSLQYLGNLSSAVNGQIIQLLSDQKTQFIQSIRDDVLNFTGSGSALKNRLNLLSANLRNFRLQVRAGENVQERFENLFFLTPEVKETLNLKVGQLVTLRRLLGDVTMVNGASVAVSFQTNLWAENGLGDDLPRLVERLKESFKEAKPKYEGHYDAARLSDEQFVREITTFTFPDSDRTFTKTRDIPAKWKKDYRHEDVPKDQNKVPFSTLVNIFTFQQDGKQKEHREDGAEIPHVISGKVEMITDINFSPNNKFVNITIKTPYKRPEGTKSYTKETPVRKHVETEKPELVDCNEKKETSEFITCYTTHDGKRLELGKHLLACFSYPRYEKEEIKAIIMPGTVFDETAVKNNKVLLEITTPYLRGDGEIYRDKRKNLEAIPVKGLTPRYDHDNKSLQSKRFYSYSATYDGITVPLGELEDGYEDYTKGNIVGAPGYDPETVDLNTKTVILKLTRAYKKPGAGPNDEKIEKIEDLATTIVEGAQTRLEPDDRNLLIKRYVICSALHEGTVIQLGERQIGTLPYNDDEFIRGGLMPEIARGYRNIYRRFLNGKLIYRPTPGSDEGKIEMLVKDIMDPSTLEGEFNLSRCGDAGKYLSINTGYRKVKKAANKDKVEIWFAPRFLIEKELNTTAGHFSDIMNESEWPRSAEIGVFWTWGNWDVLTDYDYLTNNNYSQLVNNNLYEIWRKVLTRQKGTSRGNPARSTRGLTPNHNDVLSMQTLSCLF